MVTLEHDHLYTLVPSSGIGSYASQPRETYRLTPTMLMEIMIQPQKHTKQPSKANTHAKQIQRIETKIMRQCNTTSPSQMLYGSTM